MSDPIYKTLPRGIEVLVKKAAVDPKFMVLLIEERAEAAKAIGLELTDAEAAMLQAIPREQLESIILKTEVPSNLRRVFLSACAAAMLGALGFIAFNLLVPEIHSRGISPDRIRRMEEERRRREEEEANEEAQTSETQRMHPGDWDSRTSETRK